MNLTVLVLDGPNLNMSEKREPEIYGRDTLAEIESAARSIMCGFGAHGYVLALDAFAKLAKGADQS